jgi:uncharacterized protein (TIGR00730 family)
VDDHAVVSVTGTAGTSGTPGTPGTPAEVSAAAAAPPLPTSPGPPAESTGPAGSVDPARSDRALLEGPQSRLKEVVTLFRAMRDFLRGFRALHFVGPCITIFGSARFSESHPYYAIAREMGRRVSAMGFTVMTGGGPGLMEAANRGAQEQGGLSVGCNIELAHEQAPNGYLDRWVTCHHFFVRKVLLFKYSYSFIVMPGGLGTLDELTEALTLIQNGKIKSFPVVLIGTKYWQPFVALLQEMVREGAVAPADLNLLMLTDDLDDAVEHIERYAVSGFGLKRVVKPAWWLGERGPLKN